MNMVASEKNKQNIATAVIIVVILFLAIFKRRSQTKKEPSNINKYLVQEADLKKVQIVEREEELKPKIPLYLRRPQDELKDIRETTSNLMHRNAYYNSKVEDRIERLEFQEKQINIKRPLKSIDKKNLELNRRVKNQDK